MAVREDQEPFALIVTASNELLVRTLYPYETQQHVPLICIVNFQLSRSRAHAFLYVLGVITCLGCGCVNRGPASISQQRGPYTEVIAMTDQEELLTNIVRLAYLEPPVFLQVSSVTASPSVEYGTDSELRLGDGASPNPLVLGKPRVIIKDTPTIVYKPLAGREFSNELLMPFDIRPIFLMLDNGFDFSVVAQVVFKSINGISNARSATPEEREEFRRVTDALARLIYTGAVRLGTPSLGLRSSEDGILVRINEEGLASPDGQYLVKTLGLDPTRGDFELKTGLRYDGASVAVNPRSMLALLSYMSNYVQPPAEHRSYVWPNAVRSESEPLMRIHSSKQRPDDASPVIFYKGHWFYVAADDLRSRNTLYLIRLLYNLQAQATNNQDIVHLTLPVK